MGYTTCAALQLATSLALDKVSGGNTPGQTMQQIGFLAKLAEINRTDALKIMGTRKDGGVQVNRVLYTPPASRFDTVETDSCTTDNAPCTAETDVVMETGIWKLSKFALADTRALTSELLGLTNTAATRTTLPGNDPYGYLRPGTSNVPLPGAVLNEIAKHMANDTRALLEQVNIRLLQMMQTFLSTNTAVFANLTLVKADGSVNQAALTDISWAYTNALQTGTPIVVGGNQILHRFFTLLAISCCNDAGVNTGTPGNRSAQLEWWRDAMLEQSVTSGGAAVFGSNEFFVMAPGSARFVQDNQFLGDFEFNSLSDLWAARTVEIPGTGIKIDQEIKFDDCDKVWTVKQGIPSIGLFVQPISTRNIDDNLVGLAGSSGLFTYTAVQA